MAMTVLNFVDAGGVLRQRCTIDDGDDPKTKGAPGMGRGHVTFEDFFRPYGSAGIYTHVLSVAPSEMNRWHRDAKLLVVIATR